MDYRFSLRKGSKKDVCPQCGKKTFVPYIDNTTGREAGRMYGRCERINSCRYILYPKIDKVEWYRPEPKPFVPERKIDYVRKSIVEETFKEFQTNVFFMYLIRVFGRETAFELQARYNIGTAKEGGTIFWQQDKWERFRTAKIMYYQENGRRDKTRFSWFVHKKISPDFNYKQCFFGLHLTDKTKPVALCESEKTAIMMSVFMPEYTWVASGGSEMLNVQRLSELPRLDMVFADNGQREKWEQKTKIFENRKMDLSVDIAVTDGLLPEGSDILDLWLLKKTNKTTDV